MLHIYTDAYIAVKKTRQLKVKEKDIFVDTTFDARYM